ncbi:MAG: hypothetical protein J5562_03725 [Clostridia bacterium]|nr:hypothetical protein [Clostridia bacterium]
MTNSVAPSFRKLALIIQAIGVLEIIGGIITFFVGLFGQEEVIIGVGIAVIVSGIACTWFFPLFFIAIAEALEYLKFISDNTGSGTAKTTVNSNSTTKPVSEDIPEI